VVRFRFCFWAHGFSARPKQTRLPSFKPYFDPHASYFSQLHFKLKTTGFYAA
jgi:hypothetical protein